MPAVGSSLALHQVSIFAVLGHDATVAAQTYSLVALAAAGGSIFTGFLMDRLRPGLIMVGQLGMMCLTVILAMSMRQTWMLPLYALAYGLMIATGGVFDNTVWANLFGRKYLGEIRGMATTFSSIGITLGPVLFGWCFDTFGSYDLMFTLFAVLALVQMVLAYLAPRPQRTTAITQP